MKNSKSREEQKKERKDKRTLHFSHDIAQETRNPTKPKQEHKKAKKEVSSAEDSPMVGFEKTKADAVGKVLLSGRDKQKTPRN